MVDGDGSMIMSFHYHYYYGSAQANRGTHGEKLAGVGKRWNHHDFLISHIYSYFD